MSNPPSATPDGKPTAREAISAFVHAQRSAFRSVIARGDFTEDLIDWIERRDALYAETLAKVETAHRIVLETSRAETREARRDLDVQKAALDEAVRDWHAERVERDAARSRLEVAEGLLSEIDGSLIGQYGRPLPPTCEWSVPCLHHRIAAFLADRGGRPTERGTEPSTGGEKPGGSHG